MSDLAERMPAVARPAAAPGDRLAARPWPTADRSAPRTAILAALASSRSVLVVGEAGVGKTHLVQGALADWTARRRLLSSRLADARRADGGTIADRRPQADRPMTLTVGAADRWAALEGIHLAVSGATLERATGHPGHVVRVADEPPQAPVLLHVEDAHLLDRATAQALALLVREGEVQVVATMRPVGAQTSPWLELWKDGLAERLDLRPLDPVATEALVEEALGGPVTGDTCRRIWQQTQGNPHHVRELLRHEVETGALVERNGVWVGLIGAGPAQRVLDAVGRDLDLLSSEARTALELVALAEPVPVSWLDGLVDPRVLDELVHEGLVVTGAPGASPTAGRSGLFAEPLFPVARLNPPAYADAVRALVPPSRRRQLFALMRSARAGFPTADESPSGLLRAVLWALECDVHQTGERLLRAMRAAVSLCRPEVAVQVASAALRQPLGGTGPRIDVLLVRSQAWRLLGESGRAAADLLEVSELLSTDHTGTDHRLRQIQLAAQTADLHQYHGDDPDSSLELIDDLLEGMHDDADPELRSALEVSRLTRLGTAGRFAESLEPSLTRLRTTGYGSANVLDLATPTVLGLAQTGRLAEATALASRSLRAAEVHAQRSPWLAARIRATQLVVHLWSGDLDGAERAAVPRACGDSAHPLQYAVDNIGRGLLAAARGLWTDALREHHAASASLGLIDPSGFIGYAAAAEAVAAAALGDRTAALRLVDTARRAPQRASAMVESDLRLLLLDAQLWLLQPTLRSEALTLARWCADRGLHRTELEALHRVVVVGHLLAAADPTDDAVLTRLGHLVAAVSGSRARALLSHATAIVAGDVELVAIAARDLAAQGLWLPTVRPSARLTAREREIAGLAAGGLSSRAIAERLTLSVRTVDSHLSRVFTKLGVRSRQELRSIRDV
ncbi:MAG: helix-turn-helix transcriptional regulator [Cellulomonas sp.]